jgi:heme-degrading monooxygenase HmoA
MLWLVEEDRPIVTVFRSRLRADAVANGYPAMAMEMEARARSMPGFVDFKTFAAADGERVSVVVFGSRQHHNAWRDDVDHRQAQRGGRDLFYSQYSIRVCEQTDHRQFQLSGDHPMAHHHSELTDPQLARLLDVLPSGPFTPNQALAAALSAGVVNNSADISSAIDDLEDAGLLNQVSKSPPRWERAAPGG